MVFILPNALTTFAFVLILIAVVLAFCGGVYLSNRDESPELATRRTAWVAVGLAVWLAALGAWVLTDVIATNPLLIGAFAISSNLAAVAVALSPIGKRLATLPIAWLIGFQAFRLPLEVILHSWGEQGSIPMTMTWSGSNLDVFAGLAAVLAAPLSRYRPVAWGFALLGFGLLMNVGRVAMMSSPLPFAWGQTPPLLLAMHLPYAFIVPVCVAGALCVHIVLFRKLWAER
ncbi:MAG: hypothetical protein KC912_08940 [Proteobacteria bacterium]|nr:hypothetical protein [Pseudomonadota bacterium]